MLNIIVLGVYPVALYTCVQQYTHKAVEMYDIYGREH